MAEPGRPTAVVLLHAAGLTPQMWQAQVEAIALGQAQEPETQVMAPWLAGLRPGRPAELSLTGAAAQLVGSLDAYGIENAILVGHQLGAMVALQVAATEPERVAGLVLSGAMAAPGRVALALQKGVIRMLPNRALADSGATKSDLIKALDVIASADYGRLEKVATRTLVIAGSADPLIASATQLAARLPNAEFAEVAGAGAHPNLEAPQKYNELLIAFLG